MSEPPSPSDSSDHRGIVAGRYRLGDEIGHGGRAVVYEAYDPLLQREVAVKVFLAAASGGEEQRLQQAEARLIGGMNHHALTTLFDAGVDSTGFGHPRIYLVMERIPGSDLRRHLQQHGPLSPAQLAFLGFDLAEALQFVHEHGFLHRDLKPANVLLADRRISSRIRGKLTDFGISTLIGVPDEGEYTSGTAAYLAPEQVEGESPSPASDVYALGLVLLEGLTARRAFPGDVEESAFARLGRDPEIPDTVPERLAVVLRGMTARDPADRWDLERVAMAFQTAFVQDLIDDATIAPDLLPARSPQREAQRLAALRRYDVLDNPPDDAFDEITAMAARVLDVPIALVSITDVDRVWFPSRQGWGGTEIGREVALCNSGSAEEGAWSVADALQDERTRDNPLVVGEPHVRAYAAVPLRTHDGHDLGVLCVWDTRPREFTATDLLNLTTLANVIMRDLELRLASRRAIFAR